MTLSLRVRIPLFTWSLRWVLVPRSSHRDSRLSRPEPPSVHLHHWQRFGVEVEDHQVELFAPPSPKTCQRSRKRVPMASDDGRVASQLAIEVIFSQHVDQPREPRSAAVPRKGSMMFAAMKIAKDKASTTTVWNLKKRLQQSLTTETTTSTTRCSAQEQFKCHQGCEKDNSHAYQAQFKCHFEYGKTDACTPLELCVSSLRRGHADFLCVVSVGTDGHRKESLGTTPPPVSLCQSPLRLHPWKNTTVMLDGSMAVDAANAACESIKFRNLDTRISLHGQFLPHGTHTLAPACGLRARNLAPACSEHPVVNRRCSKKKWLLLPRVNEHRMRKMVTITRMQSFDTPGHLDCRDGRTAIPLA